MKLIFITALSFIKDKANFYHYMEIINAAVNPDHISSLKIQLDKAELKQFYHEIDEHCLINILKVPSYQNRYKDNAQEQLYGRRF